MWRVYQSMKQIYLIVITVLFLSIFSGCIDSTKPPENALYTDITVKQAKEMIDLGNVFILDVRTQDEYDAGHIRNSTRIPVQDIPGLELNNSLNELPRNKKILVYCRTDRRSTLASEILVNNGFREVYNMKGGITEWINAEYEIEK
jgi:rhodanese-related sulfurtransferase